MLYLVLGLVLAAFGLLIAALTTANTLFAWISVSVSVVAAGLLVLDWIRGRRRVADAYDDLGDRSPVPDEPPFGDETPPFTETVRSDAARAASHVEPAGAEPAAALVPDGPAAAEEPADRPIDRRVDRPIDPPPDRPPDPPPAEDAGEPGEEQTDAADLFVVSDLRVEVRVVDEHPRYHLASCTYLLDKPTLPLPVVEARQLGFTPCVRCGPDATLAARHRAAR